MIELSILIPARNEMFLKRTIEDILEHSEAETEIIAVLDGCFADPPLDIHPRVTVIMHKSPVGQRAATNEAARLARGKYIMKLDAHCAFDQGFDRKMLEAIEGHDDWTMVPMMRNLHAFDWVCPDGHRRFQSPSGPCKECGKDTERDVVWRPNPDRPTSVAYCFDPEPHFQYFHGFKRRPEGKGDVTESMSLQGSCFMCTKERYMALNLCDESMGSWGSQGIEVACKTWLSGGKVMCCQKTWYAHLFRTQGGDFGFPYEQSGRQIDEAKKKARDTFFKNKWPGQKRKLHWLVERFWPVPGWNEADLVAIGGSVTPEMLARTGSAMKPKKAVVYYTHNVGDENLLETVRSQLKKCMKEKHIVSVSSEPISFGKNIVRKKGKDEAGWQDMFEKILIGLEATDAEVIFFCEHDVLYHPSHFDFIPPRRDAFYYNTNMWKIRAEDGHALYVDDCKQLSGLCAYRDTLLKHYRERVKRVRKEGFTRGNGFEPGTRNRKNGGYDDLPAIERRSEFPILDIRHGANSTQNRWRKDQFRNQKYTRGWTESDAWSIAGWDKFRGILDSILSPKPHVDAR